MKIKIDKDGDLSIQKHEKGGLIQQFCYVGGGNEFAPCNTDCPQLKIRSHYFDRVDEFADGYIADAHQIMIYTCKYSYYIKAADFVWEIK